MKTFIASASLLLTLSANAFELVLNDSLPEKVKNVIESTIQKNCSNSVSSIKKVVLTDYKVTTHRIDQGYKENEYDLSFKVLLNDATSTDLLLEIIDQLEDRSGTLLTYASDFRSEFCY